MRLKIVYTVVICHNAANTGYDAVWIRHNFNCNWHGIWLQPRRLNILHVNCICTQQKNVSKNCVNVIPFRILCEHDDGYVAYLVILSMWRICSFQPNHIRRLSSICGLYLIIFLTIHMNSRWISAQNKLFAH